MLTSTRTNGSLIEDAATDTSSNDQTVLGPAPPHKRTCTGCRVSVCRTPTDSLAANLAALRHPGLDHVPRSLCGAAFGHGEVHLQGLDGRLTVECVCAGEHCSP